MDLVVYSEDVLKFSKENSFNKWHIKHEWQCFIGISKHQEESWKYDAKRSIFDEIRGVWIADETRSPAFDISSQSKQKLRSKRISKIDKIYAN